MGCRLLPLSVACIILATTMESKHHERHDESLNLVTTTVNEIKNSSRFLSTDDSEDDGHHEMLQPSWPKPPEEATRAHKLTLHLQSRVAMALAPELSPQPTAPPSKTSTPSSSQPSIKTTPNPTPKSTPQTSQSQPSPQPSPQSSPQGSTNTLPHAASTAIEATPAPTHTSAPRPVHSIVPGPNPTPSPPAAPTLHIPTQKAVMGDHAPQATPRVSCRSCSGHGLCNEDGGCTCDAGWGKADCSEMWRPAEGTKGCPRGCSTQGRCNTKLGVCECFSAYKGADCSLPVGSFCDTRCGGHGSCVQLRRCDCIIGWEGDRCERANNISVIERQPPPPPLLDHSGGCGIGCNGHGVCEVPTGVCSCNDGWAGPSCGSASKCLNSCSGKGRCVHHVCFCNQGLGGDDCSLRADPSGVMAVLQLEATVEEFDSHLSLFLVQLGAILQLPPSDLIAVSSAAGSTMLTLQLSSGYRSSFDVAEAGVWGNLKKKVEAHQQLPLVYPIISVRIIPKKPPVQAEKYNISNQRMFYICFCLVCAFSVCLLWCCWVPPPPTIIQEPLSTKAQILAKDIMDETEYQRIPTGDDWWTYVARHK